MQERLAGYQRDKGENEENLPKAQKRQLPQLLEDLMFWTTPREHTWDTLVCVCVRAEHSEWY